MRVLNHMCGRCLFYKCGIVPWGCFASQMSLMSIRRAVLFRKVDVFFHNFLITAPRPDGLARNHKQIRITSNMPFSSVSLRGVHWCVSPRCTEVMQGELLLCWVPAQTLRLLPWESLSPLPFASDLPSKGISPAQAPCNTDMRTGHV